MKKMQLIGALIASILAINATTAMAVIVNLDANNHVIGAPHNISLDAGTYTITPIGTTDGGAFSSYTKWSSTNCTDPNGCATTVPTTFTGWLNWYAVSSSSLVSATIDGDASALNPDASIPGNLMYWVADGMVYPNDILALNNALSTTFTISTAGNVSLYLNDSVSTTFDNRGGMSFDINAVPIPPAVWLFGSGLLGLVGIARRKKAAA